MANNLNAFLDGVMLGIAALCTIPLFMAIIYGITKLPKLIKYLKAKRA